MGLETFHQVQQPPGPYIEVRMVLLLFSFKRSQVLLLNSRFRCGRREVNLKKKKKGLLLLLLLNVDVQSHITLRYFRLLEVGKSSLTLPQDRNFSIPCSRQGVWPGTGAGISPDARSPRIPCLSEPGQGHLEGHPRPAKVPPCLGEGGGRRRLSVC